MKKRKNTTITRFIAYLLTLAISISSINVTSVFAEAEADDIVKDLSEELAEELNDYMEETEEAIEDSASLVTAGNWYVAIEIDHLSWNAFHNRVQEAICEKYKNVGRELIITYGENNKESLRGKKGRADIYMIDKDVTYLWEIKPYSYSVEPKKSNEEILHDISIGINGFTMEEYNRDREDRKQVMERKINIFEKMVNDLEEHQMVMEEIERRKTFNIEILRSYGIDI